MNYLFSNILKTVLLTIVVQFLLASGCNKNGTRPCQFGGYSFNATAEWTPQQENYSVGDTLFIFSVIPKLLQDQINTSLTIDYSNSTGIGGNLTTSLMDTSSRSIKDAPVGSFTIFPLIGTTSVIPNKPEKGVNIFYFENSLTYDLNIGIKLTRKGLFQLAVTNLGSRGIRGKNCTNAGFNMTVTNSNKNLNLFHYALGYAPDGLLEKSIYCFRVQ